ncbi:dihydromonapterin reductase [Pseudoalteromonas pernae]|uniref:dihydromonapterin reductase n=1 Tax=Pseudoalteromonas pernae TaxID=3118054 RepID=UPI003242A6C7
MSFPILITGAGQRIGLALAQHFIHQGHAVIITYRTRHQAVDELEASGATCIQADFSCDDSIMRFIKELRHATPKLRAIIHNASSWDCEKTNKDYAQLFDAMMRIHAKVPYLINQYCEDMLKVDGEFTDVIHLTDYVVETGSPKHLAYAASKAALDNFTKSFAAKWAPDVKVNAIAPSLIIFNEDDDEQYKEKTLRKSLMGIEPGCQEIIAAVEMLLNSNYITGRSLAIDGGRHLK